MKKNKLWISGVLSAAGAVILCAAPTLGLLVLGGSAVAFFPPWLDEIVTPILLAVAGVLFYMWYRRKNSTKQSDDFDPAPKELQ